MHRIQEIHTERSYRNETLNNSLTIFTVNVRESDIFVRADNDLREITLSALHKYRSYLEAYISLHPEFLTSLRPVQFDEFAPPIIRDMIVAGRKADVGPMAAVAGAIAEYVGKDLLQYSKNVIVENGGDIFIQSQHDIHVGVLAGNSPLSGKLSIIIHKEEMPMGICTSSGTVGHSLSFGKSDAVCVKARSVALADAAATAIGNLVKSKIDISRALRIGMKIDEVLGIAIVCKDQFGAIGDIELANG
jgi:ApbE superfamily uncharacterized protein (UPF0280 family)